MRTEWGTDGRMDGQRDMTKLIVAFRSYAKAPTKFNRYAHTYVYCSRLMKAYLTLTACVPFLISGYTLAEETYRCCQIMTLSDSICHFGLVAILSQACFQMYTQLKPGRTQQKKNHINLQAQNTTALQCYAFWTGIHSLAFDLALLCHHQSHTCFRESAALFFHHF